jgi:hypothetical protein
MHQWIMPQLMDAEAKRSEAERKLASVQSESESAGKRLAQLEAERGGYSDRLAALQTKLEEATGTKAADPAEVALPEDDAVVDASAETSEAESPAPAEGGERGPGRDRGDRWGGGTPEEREARRQEFATRMQENMSNFFTGELEKSSTPEMQERLVALEQKTQELFDLRNQMRAAETEEEREALGQALGETMAAAREIMQEQQGDMLGAIANQFGITKEADQAAFEQAVRSAMESPMFSDNPASLFWNAGRQADGGEGFGGRGFGGGGFGGGGFRGGPVR